MSTIIFPSDPLNEKRVDPVFRDEYLAARNEGFYTHLVNHDHVQKGAFTFVSLPETNDAIYRGWMIDPDRYQELVNVGNHEGCLFRARSDDYRKAHTIPSWVGSFKDFTAQTVYTQGESIDEFIQACKFFGNRAVVIRDYVKSEKYYWGEAMFIPDVSNERVARAVATRFRELRGRDFTGGFVVREFENYGRVEMRTWWVDGELRNITSHPDTPNESFRLEMPKGFEEAMWKLNLPFVTADFAFREFNGWHRLVEIGDGQVSGWPKSADLSNLFKSLIRN